MKKLILSLLAVLAITGRAYGDITTPYLGLTLPTTVAADVWGTRLNNDFIIIDSTIGALSSQLSGDSSFGVLKASQVFISTPAYSGSEKLAVNGSAKFFGPTGGVISMCDANGINCTNMSLETADPTKGIVVSSITASSLHVGSGAHYYPGSFNTDFSVSNGNTVYLPGSVYLSGTGSYTGVRSLMTPTNSNYAWNLYDQWSTNAAGSVFHQIFHPEITATNINGQEYGNMQMGGIFNTSNSTVKFNGIRMSPIFNTSSAATMRGIYVNYTDSNTVVNTDYGIYVDSTSITNPNAKWTAAYFNGPVGFQSLTSAQIKGSTPAAVGQYVYCSDCTTVTTCVSTGTVTGAWSLITSRTTACN